LSYSVVVSSVVNEQLSRDGEEGGRSQVWSYCGDAVGVLVDRCSGSADAVADATTRPVLRRYTA